MPKEKSKVAKEEVGTEQKESELDILDKSPQVRHIRMLNKKYEKPKESR